MDRLTVSKRINTYNEILIAKYVSENNAKDAQNYLLKNFEYSDEFIITNVVDNTLLIYGIHSFVFLQEVLLALEEKGAVDFDYKKLVLK